MYGAYRNRSVFTKIVFQFDVLLEFILLRGYRVKLLDDKNITLRLRCGQMFIGGIVHAGETLVRMVFCAQKYYLHALRGAGSTAAAILPRSASWMLLLRHSAEVRGGYP